MKKGDKVWVLVSDARYGMDHNDTPVWVTEATVITVGEDGCKLSFFNGAEERFRAYDVIHETRLEAYEEFLKYLETEKSVVEYKIKKIKQQEA